MIKALRTDFLVWSVFVIISDSSLLISLRFLAYEIRASAMTSCNFRDDLQAATNEL